MCSSLLIVDIVIFLSITINLFATLYSALVYIVFYVLDVLR